MRDREYHPVCFICMHMGGPPGGNINSGFTCAKLDSLIYSNSSG